MDAKITKIAGIPAVTFGEPAESAYLYVHGRLARKEEACELADIVCPKGYQVIGFDLPEHGDRKGEPTACTVQNGVADLRRVLAEVAPRYRSLSLHACSLGAYFSLIAFADVRFERCLFLSPILDMERLIRNMMAWASVSEERLQTEREVATPFGETLSWDYFEYVRAHPVVKWESPTSILYGDRDNLTERDVLDSFVRRFGCELEVMPGGEHYFHTREQMAVLRAWLGSRLQ